jgi:protein involved in temperature-dependent protein secretion
VRYVIERDRTAEPVNAARLEAVLALLRENRGTQSSPHRQIACQVGMSNGGSALGGCAHWGSRSRTVPPSFRDLLQTPDILTRTL